ncbi:phage tail protein I [Floridanema aerugineum]|uniref:Phage tail protein I n=1 Tax=Floridaenema aerugineum BLCC-F46 TaxID=3153654 RepID=A0ABV4X255_9CYAN
MNDGQKAWSEGRPVFYRLPEKNYQDNEVADALTSWTDSKLVEKKEQLENFYKYLDPDTCPDHLLDYLAFLVGMSGNYWDVKWSAKVKRDFIRYAHVFLWRTKGTLACIKKVLDIHELEYDIWSKARLYLTFKMGVNAKMYESERLRLVVRVPFKYPRQRENWKEVERSLRNYAPAVVETKVSYPYFNMGTSRIGDLMFEKPV